MAKGRRYYWIKLKESFMTSDIVDYLMSQPDGANYVVLYQMLCFKAINSAGRLSWQLGEIIVPFSAEKIQRDCKWFTIDTVRIALHLYKALGLIYEDVDGTIVVSGYDDLVGGETDFARQKREQRTSQLQRGQCLPECLDSAQDNSMDNVQDDIADSTQDNVRDSAVDNVHIDIRDRYKRLDIESIESKNEGNTVDCPELEASSGPPSPSVPPVISLPLVDGSNYGVTQPEIDKYAGLYPAVDIGQELRDMVGWLDANPKRRKTRGGVKRFINNWLSAEQDKGGTLRNASVRSKRTTYSDDERPF